MKTSYKTAGAVITALFLLTGCNSSSGSFQGEDATTTQRVYLVIDEQTEIVSGDSYVAESDDAKVKLRHLVEADKKYVTLLEGSAYLERVVQ